MAATRTAQVTWEGDLFHGQGKVTAGSSGLFKDAAVTWASRTETSQGRASSEELLAAAHASCFAMALSNGLAGQGKKAERLDVTATVTFDKVGEGFKVTSSVLEVRGKVPGLDAAAFQQAAEAAKEGCPVSQALKGNVRLSVTASLAG